MMREYHVRFCEGLGVKFPGPTRQKQKSGGGVRMSAIHPTTEVLGRMSEAEGEAEVIPDHQNFRV
jgi:hypothetical protein